MVTDLNPKPMPCDILFADPDGCWERVICDDAVTQRLGALEKKMSDLDEKLNAMEGTLSQLGGRLEAIMKALESVRANMVRAEDLNRVQRDLKDALPTQTRRFWH